MAIIPQISLFRWQDDIDCLGDLERLKLVFDNLPDEELVRILEKERGNGRDDYPVRCMWNSVVAGVVFQHPTIASLIRELQRNVQLRYVCGFDHIDKVPSSYNYSRFLNLLLKHQTELDQIFQELVRELTEILPEFGQHLSMDSKSIPSYAKRPNKNNKPDGRRETDADLGVKTYHGVREDGTPWEKIVKCFGFKLHLIVDSTYELPVAYSVTKASTADVIEGHKLIEKLAEEQPEVIDACDYLCADKGYDDSKLINKLMDPAYGIKPVIDTRQLWKDEKERPLPGYQNIYYNERGEVFCYDAKNGERRTMSCDGYETSRHCLRKKCPVKSYGIKCPSFGRCPNQGGIRIPLSTDSRIFTAVDRSSYKWASEYALRTSVERVNSRLDVSFGFEVHTIRGEKKMTLCCGLSLITMLAMALGRARQNQEHLIRSLVRSG
ncbi:MAG: transposase [Syntrophorhabdus sp.]